MTRVRDPMTEFPGIPDRIAAFVRNLFGVACLMDRRERAMRVVEEALELAQAEGVRIRDVERIAEHVYAKPVGKPAQEAAGVSVCLIAWAYAAGEDLDILTEREVSRVEAMSPTVMRLRQEVKAKAGISIPPCSCNLELTGMRHEEGCRRWPK